MGLGGGEGGQGASPGAVYRPGSPRSGRIYVGLEVYDGAVEVEALHEDEGRQTPVVGTQKRSDTFDDSCLVQYQFIKLSTSSPCISSNCRA